MPRLSPISNRKFTTRPPRAFTIIEILVVVGILILLVAITIPALSSAKATAKKAATQSLLTALQTAINSYYTDFNTYPPSSNDNGPTNSYPSPPFNSPPLTGTRARNRGPAMLAQSLMGYLPGGYDGASPDPNYTTPPTFQNDPHFGFRIRKNALGKIYGPYMADDPKSYLTNTLTTITSPPTMDQVFIDPYGNEVLYFRALGNQNAPNPSNLPIRVFGSKSIEKATIIPLFNSDDNDIDFNNKYINNPAPIQPITGDDIGMPNVVPPSAFFGLLYHYKQPSSSYPPAPLNDISPTISGTAPDGPVLGASTYLLISPGPDKTPYSADDVIMSDH